MSYIVMAALTAGLFAAEKERTFLLARSFFSSVFSAPKKNEVLSVLRTVFCSSVTMAAVSLTYRISSAVFECGEILSVRTTEIIYLIFGSVIAVPFAEEFFFRGILLGRLLVLDVKKREAVIVSGIVFALFHPPCSVPFALAGGILISAFTVMSGSFRTGLAIHFANNCHALCRAVFSAQVMFYINAAVGLAGVISGLLLLIGKRRKNFERL